MKIQDYAFIAIVLIVAILVLRGCDNNINYREVRDDRHDHSTTTK